MSFLGLVALAGVVTNDSIVLVDCANRLLRNGMPLHEALIACGKRRFRAVFLTSITTIGGISPLMLENSFHTQMLVVKKRVKSFVAMSKLTKGRPVTVVVIKEDDGTWVPLISTDPAMNMVLYVTTELATWDRSAAELVNRRHRPWDDADRRPSHEDRRNFCVMVFWRTNLMRL